MKAAGAFRTDLSAEEMWDDPLLHGLIEFGRYRCVHSSESFFFLLSFNRVSNASNPEDVHAIAS